MLALLRALSNAGALRPTLPRPALLRTLALLPLRSTSLGTAVELQAGLRANAAAIVDDRGTLSWRELDARVDRLARVLLSAADPGDAVAMLLRNGRELVECYAACGRAGLVAVPGNTWWSAADLAHMVDTQSPRVLVADADLLEGVADAIPADLRVVCVGGGGRFPYEEVLARAPGGTPVVRSTGRVVVHTSGTTGRAKGAERSLGASAVGHLVQLLQKVPLQRDDRFLIAPPLFHTFAQGMLGVALALGTTVVLTRRFEPDAVRRLLVDESVTAAAVVPSMLSRLLDADGPEPAALRLVVSSGSGMSVALRERAQATLGAGCYDLYGSTEVGWATIATPEDAASRPGTVGRPGGGMRIVVADTDDRPLPPGEVGRVLADSGWTFSGYTGGEDDARVGDAIDTGDLGWLDEDGYLFLAGRADDMVVSGGENIYPAEVEDALHAHPAVAEAAVAGVEDADLGQALHAWVVPAAGERLDEQAVRTFLRERLARYKVPKRFHVVDVLPRNATGKVVKRELRP